ncbi:hypothetical protein KFL_007890090 [Klebsormidium nitens]|uniref:Uncharacterized protein n=1 Tax=Klebsormidium nitens TaxID=105231 RepID=A0A1Y1IQD3_KLENI|nr:hypothetical protein KFL_007890090 [Klebsormidium nitens]|eukprot:GAQ91461.1 hypothetical protein KFL_007890090 [Klebsormidium nitens]
MAAPYTDGMATELYLDEDPLKVSGISFAIVSFATPNGPQKCSTFGLKIRGAFDTLEDANAHVKRLIALDPNFDIFVVDCYRWLRMPPDPEVIDKQIYQDPQLNAIMAGHKDEQLKAKAHFEERKRQVMAEGLDAVAEEGGGGASTSAGPSQ